jgi:predicted ABC-type ATPase
MASPQPHLIVLAGPNGAGKSTTAPALLKGTLEVKEFVNGT